MSTLTTRLGLYKPDSAGIEFVNVVTDVNNNFDSLDAKMGAFACTSATRPGTPYNGQFIRETDTGKLMLWDGASWKQVLYDTPQFVNALSTAAGLTALGQVDVTRALVTDHAFRSKITGDTQQRLITQADGKMLWGPGGVSTSDTNLYRAGTDTLKTDDSFQVVGALTVTGATSLSSLALSGTLDLGSARFRTNLSTRTTVANTTTETAVASYTIPPNDAAVGAVWRMKVWGTLAVTGTPTITLRAKLDSSSIVGFNAVTVRSGAIDGWWELEFYVTCMTTGVTGTFNGFSKYTHNFLTSAGTYTPVGPVVISTLTKDTTAAIVMQMTATWSAASPSNTITCQGFSSERIA
jgi:hypothetical protein